MATASDLGGATGIVQTETIDFGPGNKAVRGMRIAFTTAKGHQASVFVPLANYSADAARAAVKKMALEVDAVG
jgi:hypothetical protein